MAAAAALDHDQRGASLDFEKLAWELLTYRLKEILAASKVKVRVEPKAAKPAAEARQESDELVPTGTQQAKPAGDPTARPRQSRLGGAERAHAAGRACVRWCTNT